MPMPIILTNVIKLFTVVIYECSKLARLFVLGMTFQPSVLFASNVLSITSLSIVTNNVTFSIVLRSVSFTLVVAIKPGMLSAIILNVIMLIVEELWYQIQKIKKN
jgi:hypothetical protein